MNIISNIFKVIVGIIFISSSTVAAAEIQDIDTSNWAVDPQQYEMSPKEYIQAESRAFLANFIERSGLNNFHHFKTLATAEDKWVVSPNLDTIYSIATVNVQDGFTLKLPEVKDRFLSVQIITENHMTPFYFYGGGTRTFKASDFDSDFVAVGVRMGTNGTKEDVQYVVDKLQPKYFIEGAKNEDTLIRPDTKKMLVVREALLSAYNKLPDTFDVMQKSTDLVNDWEKFTYVTAGGWGLSADKNAMYKPYSTHALKGNTCYTATFQPIQAKAFFSITVYGPDKYLMSDENNVIGSNHDIRMNDDGTFTVVFGDTVCKDLAPNFLYTPKNGWNYMIRAYEPDVNAFKKYELPVLKKNSDQVSL